MKFDIRTHQSQKQILAPAMQQSIEILMLPLAELSQAIEAELQDNPLLEIDDPSEASSSKEESTQLDKQLKELQNTPEISGTNHYSDDLNPPENPLGNVETLEDHLNRQLRIETDDPVELTIGEYIIGNIDTDGYLAVTPEEVILNLALTDMQRVESVIQKIRTFDPPGIASQNLKECLLIQAKEIANQDQMVLIGNIIEHHLKDLGLKKHDLIAKSLQVSLEQVRTAAALISSLDPRPARNFQQSGPQIYIQPDAYMIKTDDGYQLHLNRKDIPLLRVNATYQKLLKRNLLTKEERGYIRERLRSAVQFIRCIEQRGTTLSQITNFICSKQKNFFENGAKSLLPMTLKDVAQHLERNESTISRAISNKYIDTPQGLLPYKYFFSQRVAQSGPQSSADVSNRRIKEELRSLIDEEDRDRPLSDIELQKLLAKNGLKIARRTISKYRQAMDIQPSHLRKNR